MQLIPNPLIIPVGLVIGILVAAPVGPVNVLCIQRAIERGFWGGILLHSNSVNNRLTYATIEYGGSHPLYFVNAERANLLISSYGGASRGEVRNCTIRNSGGWGAQINVGATVNGDFDSANAFSNNVLGPVFRGP